MFDKIKEFYDNNRCYLNEQICGSERTILEKGGFFPSPYPYIGKKYYSPTIENKTVPKIFCLSVNQNLSKKENGTEEQARMSLYPTDTSNLEEHMYGPLDLCVSLANIAFSIYFKNNKFILNNEIMKNISYTNCVRCGNPTARSGKPTEVMIQNCKKFTEFEINTLQPDMIFCIGRDPFGQIKSIYKSKNLITDFVFQIKINYKTINVIYFYHYGIQQSVNTGRKMIKLFSEFNPHAKEFINDVQKEIKKYDVWRKQPYVYNDFAKYYAIKIIEKIITNKS